MTHSATAEFVDHDARRAIADVAEAEAGHYRSLARTLQGIHDDRKAERAHDRAAAARQHAATSRTLSTIVERLDKTETDADARDRATAAVHHRARHAERVSEELSLAHEKTRGVLNTLSSEHAQARGFRTWARDLVVQNRVTATAVYLAALHALAWALSHVPSLFK